LNISSKLSVYCNGTEGLITSTCPIVYTYPSCAVIGSDSSCIVSNYTSSTTTCACSICPNSHRRRLSIATIGVIEVSSLTKYAFNDFADVISTSASIGVVDLITSTYIVTSTFTVVWLILLSMVVYPKIKLLFFPRVIDKNILNTNLIKQRKRRRKVQPLTNDTKRELKLQKKLHDYISSFFQGVYCEDNTWDRLSTELMRGHLYLAVINEKDNYVKITQFAQIFTYLSANFFLIAFLFDIRFPSDDGSCDGFISEESCLSLHSLTDASVNRCFWTTSNSDNVDGICSFAIPEFSFMTIIYVTIVSVFVSGPILFLIDFLFLNILLAPTIKDIKDERKVDAGLRRMFDSTIRGINQQMRRFSGFTYIKKLKIESSFLSDTLFVPSIIRNLRSEATLAMIKTKIKTPYHEQLTKLHKKTLLSTVKKEWNKESDSDSDIEDQNKISFDSFLSILIKHRNKIKINSQRMDFNNEWSLLSDEDNFIQEPCKISIKRFQRKYGKSSSKCNIFSSKVDENVTIKKVISNEIEYVKEHSSKLASKLKNSTSSAAGAELIKLFVFDILGRDTNESILLEKKLGKKLRNKKVVSMTMKSLTGTGVFVLNLYFFFTCLLYGHAKGRSWQIGWMYMCITNFIADILVTRVFQSFLLDFAIPNTVSSSASKIRDQIYDLVLQLCRDNENQDNKTNNNKNKSFSAPDYLFISTQVAKKMPELLESSLILSYKNSLPGQLKLKWNEIKTTDTTNNNDKNNINNTEAEFLSFRYFKLKFLYFLKELSTVITYCLVWIGLCHGGVQLMLVNILQSPIFAAIVVIINIVARNPTIRIIVLLAILQIIALIFMRYYTKCNQIQSKEEIENEFMEKLKESGVVSTKLQRKESINQKVTTNANIKIDMEPVDTTTTTTKEDSIQQAESVVIESFKGELKYNPSPNPYKKILNFAMNYKEKHSLSDTEYSKVLHFFQSNPEVVDDMYHISDKDSDINSDIDSDLDNGDDAVDNISDNTITSSSSSSYSSSSSSSYSSSYSSSSSSTNNKSNNNYNKSTNINDNNDNKDNNDNNNNKNNNGTDNINNKDNTNNNKDNNDKANKNPFIKTTIIAPGIFSDSDYDSDGSYVSDSYISDCKFYDTYPDKMGDNIEISDRGNGVNIITNYPDLHSDSDGYSTDSYCFNSS
jgi:hypothetical protein